MSVDVSLILNLHREARYVPRTLMSLRDAAAYAAAQGISVELVVVLDRADPQTRAVIEQSDFSTFPLVQIRETDHGAAGPARNSGCAAARGKYVRFCDGDDLISFNLIAASFNEAELRGPKAILICEWLFAFGARYHVARFFDLAVITPLALLDIHPFVSSVFFRRELFPSLKFDDMQLSAGYAYEDWHFNSEAVARGCEFFAVPDTILFYRQRDEGLNSQANRISTRQIPPSDLFKPPVFIYYCKAAYEQLSKGTHPRVALNSKRYLESSSARFLMAAANRIEPAIEPSLIHQGGEYSVFDATNSQIGKRYFEICEELNVEKFDDVFLVPFFGKGGAERYLANIIAELARQPSPSMLVITGEPHDDNEWLGKLPSCVVSFDIARHLDEIGEDGLDLITLRLIQSVARRARLHVRASVFGQRFLRKYGRALKDNKRIFYRFSQEVRLDADANFALPFTFQFLSENIEDIDFIVTDSKAVIGYDGPRLAVTPEKWRLIPSRLVPRLGREKAVQRTQNKPKRLLWASRLAVEKRPEVLIALARLLAKMESDFVLDVYGVPWGNYKAEAFVGLSHVRFHGAYSRFEDIVSDDHLCFIYTSAYDGVPNVLLEAASMGLAIIAPDVGGIGQFVEHDQIGILVPTLADPDALAELYLAAVVRLEQEPGLRRQLAENAYDRLVARHGFAAFERAVADAFDLPKPNSIEFTPNSVAAMIE